MGTFSPASVPGIPSWISGRASLGRGLSEKEASSGSSCHPTPIHRRRISKHLGRSHASQVFQVSHHGVG